MLKFNHLGVYSFSQDIHKGHAVKRTQSHFSHTLVAFVFGMI